MSLFKFGVRDRAVVDRNARLVRAVKPVCETLETRRLFSLQITWDPDLWTFMVHGTSGDDVIDVVVGVDTLNNLSFRIYDNGQYFGMINDPYLTVRGYEGNDRITVTGNTDSRIRLLALEGGDGNDVITGSGNHETIIGEGGNDSLAGMYGDDVLEGGAGNDTVGGNPGNDTVCGNDGDDVLYGSDGDDSMLGGAGNDTLDGYLGADTLNGDGGYDTIDYSYRTENLSFNLTNNNADDGAAGEGDVVLKAWTILLGDGNDTFVGHSRGETVLGGRGHDSLYGGDGNDSLRGDGGSDYLNGEGGDDTLHGGGGLGADELRGGSGIDTADYSGRPNTHHLDLDSDGLADDGVSGEGDLISSCPIIIGGFGNDTITGSSGSDTLYGGEGNDRIDGKSGTNYIYGEGGADSIFANTGLGIVYGGDGDDTFYANDSTDDADTLRGDLGLDVLSSLDPLDDWLE